MHSKNHRLARTTLMLSTALALAAGCTSHATPNSNSQSAAASPAERSSATKPAVPVRPVPTKVPNQPGARKAAVITDCAADAHGWHASGTVKNAASADATYTITVFFTNQSATVLGFASKQVPVGPGATADWSVTDATVNSSHTRCVLRGVAVT